MEMVVVSSNWVKNIAPFPPSSTEEEIIDNTEQEADGTAAKAILICRPNSHHFQLRTLTLEQPIKVGRSVARAKPASNNAVFDCKVLSRHHALLWYDNGKFYLQDTKSSNGTFVNNNKLTDQNHEVSSGDIVQFGVDVVENNRKVTHGCIIATLKLYLPDGKEAKASPSITEGDRHGVVPLDDLYKLNEIIQEANQREQCLETKLNALQNVVEKTKKSAEESWQAYVGEERLLSRLSTLEAQLQQASKNWTEDRLKEEIAKLRENSDQYQEAAKLALEKVHAEKLEAVNVAIEQERSKISAQQDALLSKEQLAQTQLEIQDIAQKLTELQTQTEEEKVEHDKHVQELQFHLEEEEAKVAELEAKIYELTMELRQKEKEEDEHKWPGLILNDDFKGKEEMLLEDDPLSPSDVWNKLTSQSQNYINLVVAPVEEKCAKKNLEEDQCESVKKDEEKEIKKVSFVLLEKEGSDSPTAPIFDDSLEKEQDPIDSKTLKYQYQSAQKEQHQLRVKIQQLEKISNSNKNKIEYLEELLTREKDLSEQRLFNSEKLQEELTVIERKWRDSCHENQQLNDKVYLLLQQLEINKKCEKSEQENENVGNNVINEKVTQESDVDKCLKEFNTTLEDELINLREKYAQILEEKLKLQQNLFQMTTQYNKMVDRIQNKLFFYIAPLVFVIIYLLINEWFS